MRITALLFLLFVSVKSYTQVAAEKDSAIFTKVDKEAAYIGGDGSWKSFLEKNMNPAVPVDNGSPAGYYTVMVQFIVDTGGHVADITALTKWGYGMEQEVVRLIKTSGLWSPAMIGETPVNAYRKQPVTFLVMEDGFDVTIKGSIYLFTDMDNELTVEVDKVKNDDLDVTISQGKVIPAADGKYIVRVTKPGRVILYVSNRKKSKQHWEMSFEVKRKTDALFGTK